jgi:hypothetical protein
MGEKVSDMRRIEYRWGREYRCGEESETEAGAESEIETGEESETVAAKNSIFSRTLVQAPA